MGNFRCQGCRGYKPNPPHRRLGLGGVCSQACFDKVQARRNKPKASSSTKPKSTKPAKRKDDVPTATRKLVLARDGHRCRCCGTNRNLVTHHIRYRSEGVDHSPHNLITLCNDVCHPLIHSDKKRFKPLCLAYVWLVTVEHEQHMLPLLERKLSEIR